MRRRMKRRINGSGWLEGLFLEVWDRSRGSNLIEIWRRKNWGKSAARPWSRHCTTKTGGKKLGKYNIFVYIGQLRMQNIFMWSKRHLNRKGRWFIWSCSEKLIIGLLSTWLHNSFRLLHALGYNTVSWYPVRVLERSPSSDIILRCFGRLQAPTYS